jgi:nucleotide-binding universal stress UspA family protein
MASPPLRELTASEDDSPDGTPVVSGRSDGRHVLVPLLTDAVPALTDQLKVAAALARETDAHLTVINPIGRFEGTTNAGHRDAVDGDDTALVEWALERTAGPFPQVDGDVVDARGIVRGVLRAVRRHDVETLVVPGRTKFGRLRKSVAERIAAHADADVVVVNGQAGFRKAASILLPVADGPHSKLAANVAASVAADCDAWVDVLHVVGEDAPATRLDRADELVEDVRRRIGRPETTATWVLEATEITEAIVEQSRYYGLTIIGTPTKGPLRRLIFGSTNASVRANADSVVLSVCDNVGPSDVG